MTSVLPPARRTHPPNRRELILAAATELFAARGYEYAGMSEIAEQVALIDLMISEIRSLPEHDRAAALTAQRDYVAELARLLCQVDPGRPAAIARIQVHAALMIANDVARTPHLRDQAGSAQAVAALCIQMLALRQADT